MKPVELEIFLQDGVSPGLKKAGQTLSRFSDDAKAELREVPESLNLQKSHVSGMEKEYARLEKALKNAAPGKEWMEAKARLAAYKAELDGEKTALQQLEEQQRKLKAEAEGAGQSLRQQLKTCARRLLHCCWRTAPSLKPKGRAPRGANSPGISMSLPRKPANSTMPLPTHHRQSQTPRQTHAPLTSWPVVSNWSSTASGSRLPAHRRSA